MKTTQVTQVEKWPRNAAMVLIALASQGCADMMVGVEWHDRPSHPALTPMHYVVPAAELSRACGYPEHVRLHGCAVRWVEDRVCLIYTAEKPPEWVLQHERKHCAGWDHRPLVAQAEMYRSAALVTQAADRAPAGGN